MEEQIKHIDVLTTDISIFAKRFVGCIVLTKDNKILLQQRGHDWKNYPGYLCEFGGHIEGAETPIQALIRELNEELGALVKENDVVSLGAVTERESNFTELVYVFFWHDRQGTITGCYEGEPRFFDNISEPMKHKKMMDSVRWVLSECSKRDLL